MSVTPKNQVRITRKDSCGKSQKLKESYTTRKDAWRKGFITNTPDKKTMYFTGKQTSYDTAVVFRQVLKVR